MMTQADFSRLIGVSRKTVTQMKKNGEIIVSNGKVDVSKSIERLKELGREFDESKKLIKNTDNKESIEKPTNKEKKISDEVRELNLLSEEIVPEQNLANMPEEEKREREKILAEARALEEEARNAATHNAVNHEEKIEELTLADAKLIKEYWAGVALKAKTEKEAGELIYREDVKAAQFALAREVREKLSSRPKMAFKMVGKDIHEIEKILEQEADEIFEMLVGGNV